MNLIHTRLPQWGDIRFRCECGLSTAEAGQGVAHAFEGHQVVRERFSGGRWVYADSLPNVMEIIIQKLRQRGESISGFTRRLNEQLERVRREHPEVESRRLF